MTIKDILLPLTSYPTPTQKCAIESAVALAANMGALVQAVAFEVNVQSPVGLYADPIGVAGILAADRKKSAYNAHELLDTFESIAREAGIAHERQLLGCRLLEIPGQLAHEARFCDLAMVPLRGPDASEQDIAGQLVFDSGRPILVFPKIPTARSRPPWTTSPWLGTSVRPRRAPSRMPCRFLAGPSKFECSP